MACDKWGLLFSMSFRCSPRELGLTSPLRIGLWDPLSNGLLAGGFNPSQKYKPNWKSSPDGGENKKYF